MAPSNGPPHTLGPCVTSASWSKVLQRYRSSKRIAMDGARYPLCELDRRVRRVQCYHRELSTVGWSKHWGLRTNACEKVHSMQSRNCSSSRSSCLLAAETPAVVNSPRKSPPSAVSESSSHFTRESRRGKECAALITPPPSLVAFGDRHFSWRRPKDSMPAIISELSCSFYLENDVD